MSKKSPGRLGKILESAHPNVPEHDAPRPDGGLVVPKCVSDGHK